MVLVAVPEPCPLGQPGPSTPGCRFVPLAQNTCRRFTAAQPVMAIPVAAVEQTQEAGSPAAASLGRSPTPSPLPIDRLDGSRTGSHRDPARLMTVRYLPRPGIAKCWEASPPATQWACSTASCKIARWVRHPPVTRLLPLSSPPFSSSSEGHGEAKSCTKGGHAVTAAAANNSRIQTTATASPAP